MSLHSYNSLRPIWTAIFCQKIASFSVITFFYYLFSHIHQIAIVIFLQKIQENAIQTRPNDGVDLLLPICCPTDVVDSE